jgi:hypothetical protein
MNYQPTFIVDDFLDNPHAILEFSKSLEYKPADNFTYPGKRSRNLFEIDLRISRYITERAISPFYDYRTILNINCTLYFQKITNNKNTGWIHRDDNLFTFILYLFEDDDIDCGTSFYDLKKDKILPWSNEAADNYKNELRIKNVRGEEYTEEEIQYKIDYENHYFNKSLNVKDKFNRLICFDSNRYHAANNFSNDATDERLFLIGFIHNINTNSLDPRERILSVP